MLMFISVGSGFAQKNKNNQKNERAQWLEEYRKQKTEYMTNTMELTKEQANKFFPLYWKLQDEKFHIQKDIRHRMRDIDKKESTVSDNDYNALAADINNARLKEANLENKYYKEFEKIRPPKKLYKMHTAEMNFNRDMMQKMEKNNKQQGNKK